MIDQLDPVLDAVQLLHGNLLHHLHLARVVLEHEHHVKVLQWQMDSLKVHQLQVVHGDHEWGLQILLFDVIVIEVKGIPKSENL